MSLLLMSAMLPAQEKPNILWLVCEDMSPYLGCYGNQTVKTPNIDALASKGIRFTRAHSNSTQCSPSRGTLISGVYAVSLGTDIHREKRPFPATFYFPKYLREAGYYTSNNNKQDYNNVKTPENVWNESSRKASYQNRADKKQPFFSVFNCGITHMSRVATRTTEGRAPRQVSPQAVSVPAYIPDLPEVRDDIAWNMDAVQLMDQWVGAQLAALQASGEADNTIIFFYSDHGGTVPRGKAYVYETGTQIPLIVYFPPKWKHLAGTAVPSVNNRLVSFIDFAPTVFNFAGIPTPAFMRGAPFLGKDAARHEPAYLFTFRANQGDSFCPSRAITDGKFKLIWNFQSAYPHGTRQDYQWQMPAQQAWDRAYIEKNINDPLHKKFWETAPTFELYNIQTDSLETIDLAGQQPYNRILATLKKQLSLTLRQEKDLGFMPREYRRKLQADGPLYEVVRKQNINIDKQIAAAEIASLKDLAQLKTLETFLMDADPVVQYWGASGICGLAKAGAINKIPAKAAALVENDGVIDEVKGMLAEAMVYTDNTEKGLQILLKQLASGKGFAGAALQNVGAKAAPLTADLQKLLAASSKNKYRFYIRSILINCGALPYSALYDASEKVSD
ncbi:sulfatase [Niabella insulamsoli]|uniref:sulfatase family protein n=1 Tax=Niabella insulamsoli TaxID=3144874 RepID=UPI0031FDD7DF